MKKGPDAGPYRAALSEEEAKKMREKNELHELRIRVLQPLREAIARPDIFSPAWVQMGGTYEEVQKGEAEGMTDMELLDQQHLLTLMKTALFIQEVTKNTLAEKTNIKAYEDYRMQGDPSYDTAVLLLNDLTEEEKEFLRTKWAEVAPPTKPNAKQS